MVHLNITVTGCTSKVRTQYKCDFKMWQSGKEGIFKKDDKISLQNLAV